MSSYPITDIIQSIGPIVYIDKETGMLIGVYSSDSFAIYFPVDETGDYELVKCVEADFLNLSLAGMVIIQRRARDLANAINEGTIEL